MIDYGRTAQTQLGKLDRQMAARMASHLAERVACSDNPRRLGKAMKGRRAGQWRFRVGRYRIICEVVDRTRQIIVTETEKRDKVCRIYQDAGPESVGPEGLQ